MAPVFALPAIPKLGLALKGLFGAGKAAKATQLAIPGLTKAAAGGKMATAKRFAGNALEKIVGKELMSQPTELAYRLAPDAVFGIMGGLTTPGDLGDKLIAGSTQFVGGGLTGIAAGRGARAIGMGERAAGMVDMGASFGGDMIGMQVGDGLMRGKDKLFGGEGLTPYERQSKEYEEQMRQQMEQEILAKYGMDPFMATNGLA